MLKKLINKIIMSTKCYLSLRQYSNELEETLNSNKTTARKIIRAVNSLLKKDELVTTKKQIKELCNEIIKGE